MMLCVKLSVSCFLLATVAMELVDAQESVSTTQEPTVPPNIYSILGVKLGVGRVPVFRIYQHKKETNKMFEPKEVEIVPKNTEGYPRLRWSAAYSSYHKSLVQRSNYQMHAFCHTSFTENGIKLVKFVFIPGSGGSGASQQLILHKSTSSPQRWPTFGSEHSETIVKFNSSIGGSVVLKFNKDAVDMSGRISCSVQMTNGMMLTSNIYDIADIREPITKLASPRIIPGSKFYTKGASTLRPVPDNEMDVLTKLSEVSSFGISWDIGTEDKTIATSPRYRMVENLFEPMNYMSSAVVGQYFIDSVGNLHLNWESMKGKRLYNVLKYEGKFARDIRKILMLSDSSNMVGRKFHVAKYTDKSNFIDGSLNPLPRRCIPTGKYQQLEVFSGNLDKIMQCGFLAQRKNVNSDMRVQWFYNNQLLDDEQMTKEYGLKRMDNGVGATLDLRNIKVKAAGQWKCKLVEDAVPVPGMEAVYNLRVIRYPGFGEFSADTNSFLGKPPQLVYAMDGSTVSVNCTVTSYDKDSRAVKPKFLIDGISLDDICGSTQGSWPKNPLICSSMKANIKTVRVPITNNAERDYTETMQYTVSKLSARDDASGKSMSHMLTCSAVGQYTNKGKTMEATAKSLTSINVIGRPDPSQFTETPRNCSAESKSACKASNDNVFKCIMDKSYQKSVLQQGILIKKEWKIGIYTQAAIKGLEDPDAVLKKYIEISPDNNQLTIKGVTSADDIKTLNDMGSVSCVIQFYYPTYIRPADLRNLRIEGPGAVNPSTTKYVYRAKREATAKTTTPKYGPLLYSSDQDDTATHLQSALYLQGAPMAPQVSSAGTGMYIGICVAILIILIIILLVLFVITRNRGETYVIDEKERAQGHDPERELKDEQFKEYQRPEEGPIRGSRMSLASSIRVGSDDEGELDEYGEIDMGKFNEDGSFIGNYATDPRKRQLPPAHEATV